MAAYSLSVLKTDTLHSWLGKELLRIWQEFLCNKDNSDWWNKINHCWLVLSKRCE